MMKFNKALSVPAAGLFALFALGLMLSSTTAHAAPVAEYRFDDVAWCTPATALDTVGAHNGTLIGNVAWQDSPASGGKPVNGAAAGFSGGAIDITGLPLNLANGAMNSVSFWMYWDGTNNVMPMGFGSHDLWLQGGSFGFNTFNSDIFGISSAGLANGWHHVAAVFTNGNVASNKLWIDGVQQTLTQRAGTPNNANAVASAHLRLSGVWGNAGYKFSGMLDVVRIYSGLVTQAQVDADRALTNPAVVCPPPPPPLPPTLVAQYQMDDNWDATHATVNAVGGGPAGSFLSLYAAKVATPAVPPNKPDTCSGAAFTAATGSMRTTGVSLDLSSGGKNSVSFWMYWNGGDSQMPFGFALHDLWLYGGFFGFNSGSGDIFGISSAGLANGWHHVAAVFTNGSIPANKLWIDGVPQVLTQKRGSPNNANAHAANTFQLSSWTNDNNYRFVGTLDELKVYRGELTDALVLGDYAASCVPTPIAEYRMDEASWNGTANEVADSSGSGNNAQSFSSASTDGTSPAIAGSPGTCRYGVFDNGGTITQGYVQTPLPNLITDFTVTAWIRTTNNSVSGQRILIDDQSNSGGYGISLGDGGAGKIRFYSRAINPIILDSTYTLANNTWYFVAAVADITSRKRTIYVFDAAGALLASTSDASAFTGTWGTDGGPVSIGAETNASGELPANFHFHGNLDEVRVYQKVLSQNALAVIALQSHPCAAAGPHHLEIQHASGTGLTCASNTLTIRACADAACTTLYTGGVTGTLGATGTPTVSWDGGTGFTIAAGSSSVIKDVQVATAGSVVFSVATATPSPTNPPATCNFGAPACTFTANTAGFIFSNTTTGNTYTIPAQVSGIATPTLYLRAVQASTTNPAVCTPAIISQTTPVNMGYVCNNPAACQAGNLATINATAIAPGSTAVNLTFDANGSAPITARYDDVGQITLNANKTITPFGGATAVALNGGSNAFVVAPHHFGFSGITAGLIKAGNPFSTTVTAYNGLATPTATPNFGKEAITEGVTLTSNLVSPAGGNNPAIANNIISGGNFTNGVATMNNLSWGEVGLITLTANLTSGSYLGSALTATGTSGNVGGFIPDHLDTAVVATATTPMPCPAGLTCPTQYNGFVYSGQPFSVQVTAKNLAGGTTTNYHGAFGLSNNVTLTAWDALGSTTTQNPGPGALTNNTVVAATFSAGVGTTATPVYTFSASPTAPTNIFVRAVDSVNTVVTSLRATPSSSVEGGVKVVSGKVKISNAYGSELLPLPITATAQYWNGATYVTSTTDSLSSFAATNVVFNTYQPNLTAGNYPNSGATSVTPASVVFVNGVASYQLAKPGVTGSVDMTTNAPSYLPSNTARATFGVYKGASEFIYLRENY
jgi:MSHA biogenesis protein MshQ